MNILNIQNSFKTSKEISKIKTDTLGKIRD